MVATMNTFKLFQTFAYGDFLNQCSEKAKSVAIIETQNEVMADYPNLNLTGYDKYDAKSVGRADDNPPKVVYNVRLFPSLESLSNIW